MTTIEQLQVLLDTKEYRPKRRNHLLKLSYQEQQDILCILYSRSSTVYFNTKGEGNIPIIIETYREDVPQHAITTAMARTSRETQARCINLHFRKDILSMNFTTVKASDHGHVQDNQERYAEDDLHAECIRVLTPREKGSQTPCPLCPPMTLPGGMIRITIGYHNPVTPFTMTTTLRDTNYTIRTLLDMWRMENRGEEAIKPGETLANATTRAYSDLLQSELRRTAAAVAVLQVANMPTTEIPDTPRKTAVAREYTQYSWTAFESSIKERQASVQQLDGTMLQVIQFLRDKSQTVRTEQENEELLRRHQVRPIRHYAFPDTNIHNPPPYSVPSRTSIPTPLAVDTREIIQNTDEWIDSLPILQIVEPWPVMK